MFQDEKRSTINVFMLFVNREKSEKRKEREGNRTIVSLKRNAEKRATNKSIRRTEVFERSWPLNNENRTQQSPFIGNVAKKKTVLIKRIESWLLQQVAFRAF